MRKPSADHLASLRRAELRRPAAGHHIRARQQAQGVRALPRRRSY